MDNKWPVIASRAGVKPGVVSAIAWALLDYASQHEPRGTVAEFDTEVYAVYSGFPQAEIDAVIQAMNDKGVIVDGMLANWAKRQPKREDETGTQRVRNWREMKRSVTQSNAVFAQEEIKSRGDKDKEEKEQPPQIDPAAAVFTAYQDNIGACTKITMDKLDGDIKDYSADWVIKAIQKAVSAEKRSLSYVEGILKGWKRDGMDNGSKPSHVFAERY
jgi:DnaD/phage-associated family protein